MSVPQVYTASYILEKSCGLKKMEIVGEVSAHEIQTSANIRAYIIQKYSAMFVSCCKKANCLFEGNAEFDILMTGVSQKFLDLKSTIQLTKLLLFLHCEVFNSDKIVEIIFYDEFELNECEFGSNSELVSDQKVPVTAKHVHFNNHDGSNISPPNDRRPGSWVDTWNDVCRLQTVLSSLHTMTQFCAKSGLMSVFEGLIKGIAYLTVRINAQKSIRTLRLAVPNTNPSFSVSSLLARLELLLPEMCLSLAGEAWQGGRAANPLTCEIVHNRTLLRCKAVWMSAAVLRYHLRWLLDAPPAVLSTPTGGGPVAVTSNPDEANSHYRSAVWSSLDLVFDTQQDALIFSFDDKDPRLEACIFAIDSSLSPSSGSNLSYLFAEALRQINTAIVLSASVLGGSFNAREALTRGVCFDKALADLAKRTKDVDARAELHQTFLAAETSRQFVWSLLSLTPGIEEAAEVVEGRNPQEPLLTAWAQMQQVAATIVNLGLQDEEEHLHLMSEGFSGLKTLASLPLLSAANTARCHKELSAFYGHWLDQLLISYSAPKVPAKTKAAVPKKKAPCGANHPVYDMAAFDDMLSGRPLLKFPQLVVKNEVLSFYQELSLPVNSSVSLESSAAGAFAVDVVEKEAEEAEVVPPPSPVMLPDDEEDEVELEVRGKASRRRRSVCASRVVQEVAVVREKSARKPPAVRSALPPPPPKKAASSPVVDDLPVVSNNYVEESAAPPVDVAGWALAADVFTEEGFPLQEPVEGEGLFSEDDWAASSAMFCYDPEEENEEKQEGEMGGEGMLLHMPPSPPVVARPKRRASISAAERIRSATSSRALTSSTATDDNNQQIRGRRRRGGELKAPALLFEPLLEEEKDEKKEEEEEEEVKGVEFDQSEKGESSAMSSLLPILSSAKKLPRGRRASVSPAAWKRQTARESQSAVEVNCEDAPVPPSPSTSAFQSLALNSPVGGGCPSPAPSLDLSMCSTVPEESFFLSGAVFSYDPDLDDHQQQQYEPCVAWQQAGDDPVDSRVDFSILDVDEEPGCWAAVEDDTGGFFADDGAPDPTFQPDEVVQREQFEEVAQCTSQASAKLEDAPVAAALEEDEVAVACESDARKQDSKSRRASIAPSGRKKVIQTTTGWDDGSLQMQDDSWAIGSTDIIFQTETTDFVSADSVLPQILTPPLARSTRNRRASFTNASLLIRSVTATSRPRRGLQPIPSETYPNESTEQLGEAVAHDASSLHSVLPNSLDVADPIDPPLVDILLSSSSLSCVPAKKKDKTLRGRRASVAPAARRKGAMVEDDEAENVQTDESMVVERRIVADAMPVVVEERPQEQSSVDADATLLDAFSPLLESALLEQQGAEEDEEGFCGGAMFEYDPELVFYDAETKPLSWGQQEPLVTASAATESSSKVRYNRRASFTGVAERIRGATSTRRGAKKDLLDAAPQEALSHCCQEEPVTEERVAQNENEIEEEDEEVEEASDCLMRQDTFVPTYRDMLLLGQGGFPVVDEESTLAAASPAPTPVGGRAKLSRRASVCANERIRCVVENSLSPPPSSSSSFGRDQRKKRKAATGSDGSDAAVVAELSPFDDLGNTVEDATTSLSTADQNQEEVLGTRRQAKQAAASRIAELAVVKRAADSKRSRQRLRATVRKEERTALSLSVDSGDNKENESINARPEINSTGLSTLAEGKTPCKSVTLRAPLSCKGGPCDFSVHTAFTELTPGRGRGGSGVSADSSSPFARSEEDEDMNFNSGMLHWDGDDSW